MKAQRILTCLLLSIWIYPMIAQTNVDHLQRYKIAACDWMMLKRQKVGSFQLMHELGGDGVEMDMGGLGKRDSFDNKLRQPQFRILFKETAEKYQIEVPSVAMSGFFGQSFLTHHNYKALIQDCINTMKVMDAKVAFLPLGGISENWQIKGDVRNRLVLRLREVGEMAVSAGVVIGIRTALPAKEDIKLLKEIHSEGIKIYYNFQDALDNHRNLCKELRLLGRKRICQIHCTNTDGVNLVDDKAIDMDAIKRTLDKMGWSGWLVVERSRDANNVKDVKRNFGRNIEYLKQVFTPNDTSKGN